MKESTSKWWSRNSTLVTFLIFQTVALIIWGVHLDSRVATVEARGSPQVSALADRMTRVEVTQSNLLSLLHDNATKMDKMLDELHQHEIRKN